MVNGSRIKINSYGVGRIVKYEETIDSVGMNVERNILYDEFFNLVMQKSGYNCKPQDLVMSYIPHFFHNEKVLPFRITDQSSLSVYLGGTKKPSILIVYLEETPIEEDHNVDQGQQDMVNDAFDHTGMNNPDDEIEIGEGEGEGEGVGEGQAEGSDLESKFPPTPTGGSNNLCFSQTSRVNNIRDDETGFYKGMTFKNNQKLTNSLKIACLKKDFRLKKMINSRNVFSFKC